ncbi:ATP-binding protein [Streptomyces sp. NPDC087300]|uniref:ATP-binding protein n=1 Tax=Streptomyces sp. NPDC087300 TaxID=3365780 RepID=UPI00382900F7
MEGKVPEEKTSFVGREADLRRLSESLAAHRLVTLTGMGGVGKTRLAVRGALRAGGEYRDGVCWADLSPLMDDHLLTATVCDAVGLADHTPRMPVDALRSWLRAKQLLLVLDSCEHLTDQCRGLIGELLAAAPGLTVLATSRQPLLLSTERVLDVGPLPIGQPPHEGPPPEGPAAAGAAADEARIAEHSDALRLFTDRAARFVPRQTLESPDWAADAAEVCERLEGIPLALELAGGQLRHRSVRSLAEGLGSRLAELTGAPRVRPPRHQSLRTTIGWSHELCTPGERLLWARLSVLRGPFDLGIAQAVGAGGPLTRRGVTWALAGLVRQSVVGRDGARYHMLDTLKEYGRMWLAELGEEDLLADRHAECFLNLARRADTEWLGPRQTHWYRRVAEAHADLCAALHHLFDRDPTEGLELVSRVAFFWSCCGHLHEARSYLERGLALHHEPGPVHTRAQLALGVAALLQGQHETAERLGENCAREAARDGDGQGVLAAGYLRGITYLLTGRPLVARALALRALEEVPGEDFTSASRLRCRLVVVFALTALGALDEAMESARELRAVCERLDEHWTRSYLDYQLSLIALFQDRPREAADHARAMLLGKQRIGDSFGIALGLDLLAAASAAQGRAEQAALLSGTGHAYWRNVGHPQRGTPELAPLRARTEQLAREGIGSKAYARALRRGETDTGTGLALALGDDSHGAPGDDD